MGTPYPQPITDIEASFFEGSVQGLKVVNTAIIDIADPYSRGLIRPEQAYELAKQAHTPEAEAVFLSCTDLQTFSIIEKLEEELRKPVISSNSATAWAMFNKLGIRPLRDIGKLWCHLE